MNNTNEILKDLYDQWQHTLEEKHIIRKDFSSMFKMGVPNEFDKHPIIMFVGQECLRCYEYKTQEWMIKYQETQLLEHKIEDFGEPVNHSPFWRFFRELSFNKEYYPIWNNLDKFHLRGETYKDDAKIDKGTAILLNSPYFDEENNKKYSILQKEISIIEPKAVVFSIGKSKKYIESFSAAFSIDTKKLNEYKPTKEYPIHDISDLIGIQNTRVFWTYHPKYLTISKLFNYTLDYIKDRL